ncbi:hypothetical protein CEY15_17370 [Dietzia natronolimnaea]|uniref:Transposase n=1 Tax=Dietzia natronolimnaea TaxID=161920 RepID=A0A2A2WKK0_9ACTN|nr:hypothetical protein CEY15_17370 [Dietzia natronolimnaea]
MAAPRKFDAETRERAVRMYHEHLADAQCSKVAARTHVGSLLGVNPATLRNWIEAESSPSSPESTAESAEVRRLKRENAELRRANEILKTASAFFAAAELDRRLT